MRCNPGLTVNSVSILDYGCSLVVVGDVPEAWAKCTGGWRLRGIVSNPRASAMCGNHNILIQVAE